MSDILRQQTLQRVRQRLEETGDLPIFSASVNRVQMVGSDPDADAMALAVEILKDASLTTKLLRLANSPAYNRGSGKIANLSRAVVVLGFETVRNAVLTLKLIDGFQQQAGTDMTGLLVSAYLSAGFVRGIAARCEARDIEQSYICGLLHNLGELVVAHTLAQEYRQIASLQQDQGLSRTAAAQRILGANLHGLGQAVAQEWEFPQAVVQTLAEHRPGDRAPRNQTELTGLLASLAGEVMDLLYAERPAGEQDLSRLLFDISRAAGIPREQVDEALEQAFRQCCDMAQSYGLDRRHLLPRLRAGGDETLEKLAGRFSFYVRQEVAAPVSAQPATNPGDPALLLDTLYELTELMAQKTSINTLLACVLEGLRRGAGFDRALLLLLRPDHRSYAGRLASGEGAEALMQACDFPVDPDHDLFSQVILDGGELCVPDLASSEHAERLPSGFREASGTNGFILAALHGRSRPVGLFYADRALSGAPFDDTARRNFQQLVSQARIALQMR